MSYFERSMERRLELLGRSDILDAAGNAFRDRDEGYFNAGGNVYLYRVGQLESGSHVALRVFRHDKEEGQLPWRRQMKNMEYYPQNAEMVQNRGDNIPEFCVGVTDGVLVGLLTQDISNGGELEVKHNSDQDYAFVGLNQRKVFLDLDWEFNYIPSIQQKYLNFSNTIRV